MTIFQWDEKKLKSNHEKNKFLKILSSQSHISDKFTAKNIVEKVKLITIVFEKNLAIFPMIEIKK